MQHQIKSLEKLSKSQIANLKKGVIEVTGKAMNRTALGVIDAIFTLYPKITFVDLKKMLPDSINTSAPKNYKSIFKPYTERLYGVVQSGSIRQECEQAGLDISASHFIEPNEIFRTSDGVEVLVSKSWESSDTETGENNLQNLIDHIAQYGILVTKVEKKKAFNKGSYDITVINPTLLGIIQNPPKKKNYWLLLLLLFLVLAGILYFVFGGNKEAVTEPEIKELTIKETKQSPITEIITDIKSGINTEGTSLNFHEILFEYNSDKIVEESNTYLNEILKAMQDIAALSIQIIGHTSNEGRDSYNETLSLKRAQAVKNYLTKNGINAKRLSVIGKGSKNPIANNNTAEGKKLNRRIEVVILDDGIN
ncbi:OmpA family protein [uncultured Winogradskyella sp.]|uniref:OmpA family protein n=1 Tax=uncultured Winogradskyella sp. TaxID=395353 RepID=UPI0030D981A8